MNPLERNNEARDSILRSVRSHLSASVPFDERARSAHSEPLAPVSVASDSSTVSLAELFKENLEAVDGHCFIVREEAEVVRTLTHIIAELQKTRLRARRIALSDVPQLERLIQQTDLEIEELAIAPGAAELFQFDVGITTAQAAIAETGTLVLDAASERHRLVSLVPPVHIAILDASRIRQTLGEALADLQNRDELSPTITFVTGPSRTADIELTLAIGVHGPQEIFVIIYEGN